MISLLHAALVVYMAMAPGDPPAVAGASYRQPSDASPQRLEAAANGFVRSVAAPVLGREMAAWNGSICVGVGGLKVDAAQVMADRISDWAHAMDLAIEAPGCQPDVFIVVTPNGAETARTMVRNRPHQFRTGASDSDLGAEALDAFQNSDRPIRWWQVSLPVNELTNAPVRRLPGRRAWEPVTPEIRVPADLGSLGVATSTSRLTDATRDDLQQVVVVVDASAFDRASFAQVTDYVAMVSLIQVKQDAEPKQPSILALFEPVTPQAPGLTSWDAALLDAVYHGQQTSTQTSVNLSTLASNVARNLAGQVSIAP